MSVPSAPAVQPLDPVTAQAQQTAQDQLTAGLQTQARGDEGSLMAAYGKLAMNIPNPTTTTPTTPALDFGTLFGGDPAALTALMLASKGATPASAAKA